VTRRSSIHCNGCGAGIVWEPEAQLVRAAARGGGTPLPQSGDPWDLCGNCALIAADAIAALWKIEAGAARIEAAYQAAHLINRHVATKPPTVQEVQQ
jgi:hypothetical protein